MDRETWWATVHGVAKESDTTERWNNNSGSDAFSCTEIDSSVKICTEGSGNTEEGTVT